MSSALLKMGFKTLNIALSEYLVGEETWKVAHNFINFNQICFTHLKLTWMIDCNIFFQFFGHGAFAERLNIKL